MNSGRERVERRLAAILAADVAGYSRLMGADEEGTLAALKAIRRELGDPKIAEHRGRIVKTTGDGLLVEFASVVDAVRSAVELQREMALRNDSVAKERRIEFSIVINLGDIIIDEHDIYGDGVNVAARLEALAEPGGICVSRVVRDQVRDRLPFVFEDLGEHQVKNIVRPVRVYRIPPAETARTKAPLPLPDKPSLAVLPFQNMTGDAEQDYFVDGIVEEITTAISRLPWLFVIARNSSFTYKGRAVDVKQVARELGVRYVLEGSVRKAQSRVRITGQLIDAATGALRGETAIEYLPWCCDISSLYCVFGKSGSEYGNWMLMKSQFCALTGKPRIAEEGADPACRFLAETGGEQGQTTLSAETGAARSMPKKCWRWCAARQRDTMA